MHELVRAEFSSGAALLAKTVLATRSYEFSATFGPEDDTAAVHTAAVADLVPYVLFHCLSLTFHCLFTAFP